jgi:hypothetical protein
MRSANFAKNTLKKLVLIRLIRCKNLPLHDADEGRLEVMVRWYLGDTEWNKIQV